MDERTELTFMLHGLSERDAKLFRSYVLMVNHRTRHRWTWRESQADMTVAHGELAEAPAAPPALTLRVGGQPKGAFPAGGHLSMPLRADALEECLNTMGARILSVHGKPASAKAHASGLHTQHQLMLLQLRRWPSPQLLTRSHHIRLATLLTGQPTTMQTLCQRSGLSPEICAGFLNELDAAGLLRWASARPPAAPYPGNPAPDRGVLERIRLRLARFAGARP